MLKKIILVTLIIVIFNGYLLSVETGEIVGKVVDDQNSPLPGVTVTIRGPNLLQERVTNSFRDGSFRFPLLPAGTYTLKYELPGFKTVVQKEVVVHLGMTTHLTMRMEMAKVEEKITVIAEPPLIDKASSDTSYQLNARDLSALPTQSRTVADVVKYTPGVTGVRTSSRRGTPGNGLPVFRGEGEEGNNWLIDGLSIRGVRLNNAGMRLNYDAIEEIQIISDPFSPDFGSTFGGLINIVTKSGGNDFHGETAVIFRDRNLQASREEQLSISTEPEYFSRYHWYFNLGGPIIRDKLWFFLSNNFYLNYDSTRDNYLSYLFVPKGERRLATNNLFGKLSYAFNPNHTLFLTCSYDQFVNQKGGIGLPEMYDRKKFKDYFYRVNYKGILSSNTFVEAAVGQVKRDSLIEPEDGNLGPALYFIEDLAQNVHNSLGKVIDKEQRTDLTFSITHYFETENLGGHEIGAGFQYYRASSEFKTEFSGQEEDPFPGNGFDSGTKFHFDTWEGNQGTPTLLWEYGPFNFVNSIQGIGLYFRDKITWSRFALMLGFRSATQINYDDEGKGLWKWGLSDFISPRITLAIDLSKDGRNVLKLGWGRFSDTTTTLHLGFFNPQAPLQFRRYSWIGPANPDEVQLHDPTNWEFINEERRGQYKIASHIKPNFVTRYLVEFDRLITPNWALKVRFVHSRAKDLLELLGVFSLEAPYYTFIFDNFELKRRDYTGFEVEINGKIKDKLLLNASYSHASAKGTNPGQVETGSWSQEEGSTYYVGLFGNHVNVPDVPELKELKDLIDWGFGGLGGRGIGDEGWYGKLPYSVDHNVKINLTYFAPYGIIFSTALEWVSGYYWEKLGLVPFFGYYAFPEGRGSRETPPHLYVDFGIEKSFNLSNIISGLPEGVFFDLKVDVFNLFNSQRPISYVKEDIPAFGQIWARQQPRQIQVMAKIKW